MTAEDMYQKVLSMIEEYNEDAEERLTDDEDIRAKMPSIINQKQTELAEIRKIHKNFEYEVSFEAGKSKLKVTKEELEEELSRKIFQIESVQDVAYDVIGDTIIFTEEGTADIYVSVYPLDITEDNEESYKFEIDKNCLEILPYGVAGDILRSDISNAYGNKYTEEYQRLLNTLDPRLEAGSIRITGGYYI